VTEMEMTTFYLQLAVLAICARIGGEGIRRLHLPAVVGEILVGVLLGPTVLRQLMPEWHALLFPSQGHNAAVLKGITTLGATLFLFTAGMEVDLGLIRREGRSAILVSLAGLLVPFTVAFLPALLLPELFGCHSRTPPAVFALFLGVALAITSLSVTAKILLDLGLFRTPFGMLVIAAAIFDDLIGWILAAIVLALDNLHDDQALNPAGIVWMLTATFLFVGLIVTLGRPICDRLLRVLDWWCGHPSGVIGFVVGLALLGASFTEAIGIHGLFGAFMVGVAFGGSARLRPETRTSIAQVVSNFLAPLFFAGVGLGVNFIAHFDWQTVTLVLGIACLGKILGCAAAAGWAGQPRSRAWAVGFAMNGRGGMEIVLGLIGLQEEIIEERLFVALALMTVVTSSLSGLVVRRLVTGEPEEPVARTGDPQVQPFDP
jgi:Kef-type K+ transport system membrane component KefB